MNKELERKPADVKQGLGGPLLQILNIPWTTECCAAAGILFLSLIIFEDFCFLNTKTFFSEKTGIQLHNVESLFFTKTFFYGAE